MQALDILKKIKLPSNIDEFMASDATSKVAIVGAAGRLFLYVIK